MRSYVFGGESGNWELPDFGTHPLIVECVLNSIGTHARAEPADNVPPGGRNGFWADAFEDSATNTGSRVWLVQRAAKNQADLNRIVSAVEECLLWMVREGLAESVTVTGTLGSTPDAALLTVTLVEPDGTKTVVVFPNLWDNIFFSIDEA